MIRKGEKKDIGEVAQIYKNILSLEDKSTSTGWLPNIYPTKETAENAFKRGDLFVFEEEGQIVASAVINTLQDQIYQEGDWSFEGEEDEIMVLHTLVVDPSVRGKGIAKKFVKYYEDYGKAMGARCLRMDTNKINVLARKMYKNLGYREAGIVSCNFNGIPNVQLVLLEKRIHR